MLVLCYHNGALGHTVAALLDSCTDEKREFPLFIENKNLHHYKPTTISLRHPHCDVDQELKCGNTVISSTSHSQFGRLLILNLGLNKSPPYVVITENNYLKFGENIKDSFSYGEKVEIISNTIKDKILSDNDWFSDIPINLDILSFWNDPISVANFISKCGKVPDLQKVNDFCDLVIKTNSKYFNQVTHWFQIVDLILSNKECSLNLSFYDIVMIHSILINKLNLNIQEIKLLTGPPSNTKDFINLIRI